MVIVRNSIRCTKCGDEIVSEHVHDFKWCSCGAVAVDGGRDYMKRVGELDSYEETSLTKETVDLDMDEKGCD